MTPYVLTNAEKLRRLPWNTALNASNNVFASLTFFGPSFVLFLNELNFSNTQIGFLLSLFPFTGLVALVVAPAVARFGYKRTFLTFYGLRKFIAAGLLLVPWVLAEFGAEAVLLFVTLIVGGFTLCRAIAETAFYPWAQEFVPHTIRGRYAAVNDMAARLTGIAAAALASYVLGLALGLNRFVILFAVAVVFGLLAVWMASHIPGGVPIGKAQAGRVAHRHLLRVLRDRNFLLYIAGLGFLTIGTTPMGSFMPLYMEKQIGLSESHVVLMQMGGIIGGLAATYLVGWAADRYGSKPVMLSGLSVKVLLPLAYLLIPRHSDLSLPMVLLISFINGSADIAWGIGSARLLYVKVVPSEKRAEYMAVYYALIGLIGGVSSLLGGRLLDLTANLSGQFLVFTVDSFFPLFIFAIILTLASTVLLRRVEADSPVSLSEFASMFMHGNPVLALESVFRYYRARDERQTVVMTERLGQTKSPLTVDELLEGLKDPRFNVRFEAIISIARMESDPRLVEALCHILDGTELSLSNIAAWALGRIGDARALVSLRNGLDSPYRSIQGHCARSLGTLGDTSVAPLLLERLKTEADKGLRVAYASALGKLRHDEAVPTLLDVLYRTENEGARLELALALVRVVGDEHYFIKLLRQLRQDKGTAVSQSLMAARRRLHDLTPELNRRLRACSDTFARESYEQGVSLLREMIALLPPDSHTASGRAIVEACAARLAEFGDSRTEYLLLALHTLYVAVE